ncbi:glycosyltransferase family 2 protein [Paenibacillus sp. 481]|uniref:glycosyltransferase family 2 protein n=1 Tax=Paenibacillus sp. 481 TaxID=2835869 RepID=UPI001E411F85|nr:glycosyltransferase [Paenibacillus sp. 481]UHA75425.1 glycosyltransferase [Paenibacillus sp. 481]
MNDNILNEIEKYIENNDIDNALSLILSNEKGYENNADFWNLKGALCYKVNEIAIARSCFSRAIEINPDHQSAGENLNYLENQQIHHTNEDLSVVDNTEFLTKIVAVFDSMILKVESGIKNLNEGNIDTCMSILKDVQNVMSVCSGEITRLKKMVSSRFMANVFENILVCIEDCFYEYDHNGDEKLTILVEFTIHSLLKELREEVYFFGLIYPHADKMDMYYKNEFASANVNQYARQSLETGKYKYDVSIVVPAYNKLEYTKQCVESILTYTNGIDFELILVNDGSSDGTKEYFENIPYANKKVINLHKNTGAMIAYFMGVRAVQGRILASVSNDVIVTKNWLKNLLVCIESDNNIGMVVPTTNNISNNQAISAPYDTLENMHDFAKEYNKSEPNKWLERERICPFVHIVPMSVYGKGICHDRIFQYGEFCDDDISLQLRLNGYKLILAKDTFCHHFGSVSLGEAQRESNSLQISREIFKQKNKIDAWHDSKYDIGSLLSNIECKASNLINVLCIDPGLGMAPYHIRNAMKENGNPNVTLYNFSTDKDIAGISSKIFDHFISADTTADLLELFYGKTFEYIIFCKPIEEYADGELLLQNVKKLLSNNGELRFLVSNPYSANSIVSMLSINQNMTGGQVFKRFASYIAIENLLSDAGYASFNTIGITSGSSQQVVDAVKKMATSINMEVNSAHDSIYSMDSILFIVKA